LAWANVGQIEVPVVAAAVVGTAAVVALAGCVVVVEGDDVEVVVELLPDPQAVNTNPAIRAQTAKVVRVFMVKTLCQAHGDTSGHSLNSRPSRRLGTV
jgi:hypothetical protein